MGPGFAPAPAPAPAAALSYVDLREWTCEVCGITARVPHAGVTRPLPEGWCTLAQAGIQWTACGACGAALTSVVARAIAAEVALIRAKAAGLRVAHAEAGP